MASSLIPDTAAPSAASDKQAALLSVLARESAATAASTSAATPTLQFESSNGLLDDLEDSDDDLPRSGEKRSGRRKIKIEYIEDKSRRHITFSKRKAGIMKKAYELSTLTGTQVLLLVASETGHVYTFATPKLQPLITKQEGKNLIQACLNSPDHLPSPSSVSVSSSSGNSHSHAHAHPSNLADYLPAPGAYDHQDLVEEDLTQGRSASALNVAAAHGYLPTGTTPTPPAGGSASAVAAAAAQVFMNSGASSSAASAAASSYGNSGAYWTGSGASASSAGMYAPVPNKSQQQQQLHSQQQQQQQMYHALMQQQQLYQQYQQQQQIQKQPDSNDD